MRLFHICNNFISSKVHYELMSHLKEKNISQFTYVPIREKKKVTTLINQELEIEYDHVIKPKLIKYFPLIKIFKIYSSLYFNHKNKIKNSDFIMGHTLWSDGLLCLIISFIFKKNYIVCVRNTDINIFIKYLYLYRPIINLIVKKAKFIIFISKSNHNQAIDNYSLFKKYSSKIKIIPNGINDYWINNIKKNNKTKRNNEINLIYAGKLDENKNLVNTYLACSMINKEKKYFINWTIVGGTLEQLTKILNLDKLPDWVTYYPQIDSQSELSKHFYNNDIFIMPSFRETFGLVYVEAITQGCKCICSKGQGVDGLFENYNLIQYCNPYDIISIKEAIEVSYNSSPMNLDSLPTYIKNNFSWKSIADNYFELIKKDVF